MKTIICAIDYSINSIAALKYAVTLSSKISSKLYVLNIYDNSTLSSAVNEPYLLSTKELKKEKTFKLKYFCIKHIGKNFENNNIQIEVEENSSIVDEIISKAKAIKASLLITGMKGKGKFKSFLLGSTTKELISKAPCPVLAIPENAVLKQLKTIVYATDFEQEDIYALTKLSKIAAAFNSKIKIIHISPINETDGATQMEWFKEMLLQRITYKNLDFNIYSSNDVMYFLRLYLNEVQADMIAMLERSNMKSFFNKIFHNDLVIKMESLGEFPLISFNDKNSK